MVVLAHRPALAAIASNLTRLRLKDARAAWPLLLLVALFACIPAFAQSNPNEEQGLKPYDSWHGGDLDSISMTNGGLVLHIPLASFPQRGNLDLSFMVRFSNKQWRKFMPPGGHVQPSWQPAPNTGTQIVSSLDWWMQESASSETNSSGATTTTWSRSVTSPDGNTHQFATLDTMPVYPLRSLDATGLLDLDTQTLILPNGTRYSYPNLADDTNTGPPPGTFLQGVPAATVTDANGNQVSIGASGWTDTIGRLIPGSSPGTGLPVQPGVPTSDLSTCPAGTSSALVWNVPGVAGAMRTFKFCYSMVAISTQFGGAREYTGSMSLLTAIVLPDLTLWTFAYDSYANVTRLGFPTNGSIAYTYAIGPYNCGTGTTKSLWATSRTVDANDGTGGHTWTYSYSALPNPNPNLINSYSAAGLAVVTSPDGNDTVHYIATPASGSCSGYVVQTQHYQGNHSSGTLLKTEQTQYSGNQVIPGASTAINVVPTQTSATLPGGQTSKVVLTHDPLGTNPDNVPVLVGSVLQKDEYDFSNTLVRSTLNHYLWQDNTTYKSNNFVTLPVSTTLKDGAGNQMAQTTMAYDQTAVTSSGVTTGLVAPPAGGNIRGNATTASHWLNTNNSFTSSTATYFDTGMKASSTDPKGNTTAYTYLSAFAGAYMTQTNMPDTQMPDSGATVVHHVISGNYDFNTGLLTSFTDENSQTYSYQYDPLMLRLTQGNHPGGGQTIFTYPSVTQVERRRLITGTTYDDYKVNFDGLGRPIQSQQVTPSGTILADTTYDILGRVSTVSNPYYQGSSHTSDPTYGVTTTRYDALSRAIKTIKQDGSFSTVQYDAPASDGIGSSIICTTATDEAGKQRQVCADALGRMVKVLEPNPGAATTYAMGWVAVSGSEQSGNSQPGTSGSGSVTISGSEQNTTIDPCADAGTGSCPQYVWDTGSVSLTVNGYTNSASYGRNDTPSTIAAGLATVINGDPGASVTASASGATVTVTAKTTGAATNYSFITSSTTNDPNDFGSPSFGASPTSGTLTGGHDPTNGASDTGTVTATINGTAYTVSYGAGDTSSTIASRLATAVSGGSFANGSASGSTISMTSKSVGPAGDYTLSASYTWNSGAFSSPSFTTSTSGGNLTGGYNASDLANNPYVTLYQYNVRNDLLCVHQKATDTTADVACTGSTPPSVPAAWRQRFFTYDSLSRLLTATNPESGTIFYFYDANGNLLQKVSPTPNQTGSAQHTVSYCYDALNRVNGKAYSWQNCQNGQLPQGTAVVSYTYDRGTNGIGRMTSLTDQAGSATYSYDVMGRTKQTTRCITGLAQCQSFNAAYDQLGDVLTLGYPGAGFTVTYGYDAAGRLNSATDSNGVTYAQSPTILASGAMQEFISPNFNNNKFHIDYNNRLQPTEIWAGSAHTSALFDKQYSYNAPNTTQMNNGNVYTVTNVKDDNRTQSFTYDALNHLLTAGDKTHWSNSYVYDAWGNLTNKNPGSPQGENLQKAADTNNRLSGISYDAAGNVTNDGLGDTYVYDAENRIISASNSSVTTTYVYDALGRRIKKSGGSTATNYWFGPGGGTLAETDASGNWTNYIFFDGRRLARNVSGDIKYYITDHLHSTAVFADKSGTVLDDNDFYPWGGAISGVGTSTSNNHYKFTGKERDSESQLDYFGARYYANITSRFMSPDWAAKPTQVPYADLSDPQSLNLYSYVKNRPTMLVDPDGHDDDQNKPDGKVHQKYDEKTGETTSTQTTQKETKTSLGNGNWQITTTTTTTTVVTDSSNEVTSAIQTTTVTESVVPAVGPPSTELKSSSTENLAHNDPTVVNMQHQAENWRTATGKKLKELGDGLSVVPVAGKVIEGAGKLLDYLGVNLNRIAGWGQIITESECMGTCIVPTEGIQPPVENKPPK
jgi:RHS repeat-associated protein